MITTEQAIELVKPILERFKIEDVALQHSILSLSITDHVAADQLMQRARTDAFQYRVAAAWIEYQLQHGNPLPPGAVALVSDVLTEQLKPPKQKGQHKVENIGRNVRICAAVQTLIDEGLKATRNDEVNGEVEAISACDVVADVLWPGLNKYQIVKTVWANRGHHTIKPAFEPD
jgi:hypothetical protein